MNDHRILNDVEPSCDLVRRWGFDESLYFIEQDEDLVLHDERYVRVLMELSADATCPKNDFALSVLSYYSQLVILKRKRHEADRIARSIADSPHRSHERLCCWVTYFGRVHDRLIRPRPLTDEEMNSLARDLLVGLCCDRDLEKAGCIVSSYHEYSCQTESYRELVHIDPTSGDWRSALDQRQASIRRDECLDHRRS